MGAQIVKARVSVEKRRDPDKSRTSRGQVPRDLTSEERWMAQAAIWGSTALLSLVAVLGAVL